MWFGLSTWMAIMKSRTLRRYNESHPWARRATNAAVKKAAKERLTRLLDNKDVAEHWSQT